MKKHIMLSPEEAKTIATYDKIAWARSKLLDLNFYLREFERFRALCPSGIILDVGCGSGRDATLFAQNKSAYRYTGIDLSDAMLAAARELVPGTDFRNMNMYALDFAKNTFDGFWAAASLIHIPKRKVSAVLKEIACVSKPDSIGFLVMLEGDCQKMVSSYGEKRFYALYRDDEFLDMLRTGPFEVLEHAKDPRPSPSGKPSVWLNYFVKVKKPA